MEGAKRATQDDRSWKNVPSIRRTQRFSYGKKKKRVLSISKVMGRKSAETRRRD